MMDQRTKERISAAETARFMDSQFGQLDLGLFSVQHGQSPHCLSPFRTPALNRWF
jgi:hypothetical protein